MTILYEYTVGHEPFWWLAISAWVAAVLAFVFMIVMFVKEGDPSAFAILLLSATLVWLGFEACESYQYHRVKALIDDQVSWEEVNNKYRLIGQEGDIYIFEIREDIADE